MLIQLKKPNLWHCREAVSEGDAENRETRRRSVQTLMGNRETRRRRGRLATVRKNWEAYKRTSSQGNEPTKRKLLREGVGYAHVGRCDDLVRTLSHLWYKGNIL